MSLRIPPSSLFLETYWETSFQGKRCIWRPVDLRSFLSGFWDRWLKNLLGREASITHNLRSLCISQSLTREATWVFTVSNLQAQGESDNAVSTADQLAESLKAFFFFVKMQPVAGQIAEPPRILIPEILRP